MNGFSYSGFGGMGAGNAYSVGSDPMKSLDLRRSQFGFEQEQAMAPYQLGQARTGLETSQFNLGLARSMAPLQLGRERLAFQREQEEFGEFKAGEGLRTLGRNLGLLQGQQQMRLLPMQERQQKMQMEEYFGGAGLRGQQQELAGLQTTREIGQTKFASQYDPSSSDWFRERPEATKLRQYQMGREAEDLERMRMSAEKGRLQSQISAQPYMDKLRQGIMSSMGGRFGLPSMASTQQSPSWMRSYQTPSFPRY